MFPVQQPGGSNPRYNPDAPIQPIQIIVLALMMGVLFFTVIAVVSVMNRVEAGEDQTLGYFAAGFSALAVLMWLVVPRIVVSNQKAQLRAKLQTDEESEMMAALYGIFQTKTIVGDALLEGAGFLTVVAFMTTGAWWLLGVTGTLLFLMAITFPTKGQIDNFINEQKQQLDFEA